eukprot:COSAG01_NODE_1770_length_9272_cov_5.371198_9_plen_182_part_00
MLHSVSPTEAYEKRWPGRRLMMRTAMAERCFRPFAINRPLAINRPFAAQVAGARCCCTLPLRRAECRRDGEGGGARGRRSHSRLARLLGQLRPTLPAAAAAVSHSCACIGSPCLRHFVHGASIGGGGGATAHQHPTGARAAGLWHCRIEPATRVRPRRAAGRGDGPLPRARLLRAVCAERR